MRLYKTVKGLLKVLIAFGAIVSLVLENVSATKVSFRSDGITSVGLVILFSVIPHHISGRTIQNGRDILYTPRPTMVSSSSYEDVSIPSNYRPSNVVKMEKKVTTGRIARQLGLIAPALQTMGCLPKFFCGMNSKAPSESSSTLNDLAYLIKFAMVDEADSVEIRGKDDIDSEENSDEELSESQKQRMEYEADQDLIMDDPEYLGYMWKDMKTKLKNSLKEKQHDHDDFEQLMIQLDEEEKHTYKLPSIFSGLTSLVRFGRSTSDYPRQNRTMPGSRRTKSFWETQAFDEQMKLAARIGVTSDSDQKCSSTFNLCPYTINQMKSMVKGKIDSPSTQMQWYLNSNGPKEDATSKPTSRPQTTTRAPPITVTVKPNKISHLIHAYNPNSLDGRKPIATTTTTKKPIRKPYLAVKPEFEDDEATYDSGPINLELPSNVKIVKLQKQEQQKQKHQEATASLEGIIDGFATSSKEENQEVKPKIPKRPVKTTANNTKTTKIPIGLPRPKYSIRNKVQITVPPHKVPDPDSPEEDLESSQEKEDDDEEEVSSEEKDSNVNNQKPQNNKQYSKPQYEQKFKPRPKDTEESKESEELKNTTSNKGKSDYAKDSEDSQQEISSEEKQSSEEGEPSGDKPNAQQNSQTSNNHKIKTQRWPSTKSQHDHPEYVEDSSNESEYSEEGKPGKETLRPINYSYFNGKPRPTQPIPEQTQQNHGFNQQQHPGFNQIRPDNNDQQGPGFNQQQNTPNQRPVPKPSQGFFSSLFGTGSKKHSKPQSHNNVPQGQPYSNQNSPTRAQIQSSTNQRQPPNLKNQDGRQDEDSNDDDDSDEHAPQPDGPSPSPVPTVFGNTVNQRPSNAHLSQPQSGNRPGQPPRIPQYHSGNPNRPQPTGSNQRPQHFPNSRNPQQSQSTNRLPPSYKKNEKEDQNASKEDDKSEENSESKEDDKSKESEESDRKHVKDIFSKGSIETLGSDTVNNQKSTPPPPPPIANWRPAERTTKAPSTTSKPLPYNPIFPTIPGQNTKAKIPIHSPEDKDEDSAEDLQIGTDPEDRSVEDKSDEANSSEEIKKPKNKKKKVEDDETEHREPPRNRFNERIPELGEVVTTSEETYSDLIAPVPPVANFANKKNVINPPVKARPGTAPTNKLASPTRRPPRNPDGTRNTNSGPMSPGGVQNPASGMMRPMRPNNNNRMPGNNAQEDSEENGSSEETIGNSSEENENDDKSGRSSIDRKQLSNSSKGDASLNLNSSKPDPKTPQKEIKSGIKPSQKYVESQTDSKPFIQTPYRVSSLGQSISNDQANKFSPNIPPLPPIFRWKSQSSGTPKPKPRKPIKPQSRFPKPLNKKMVQYLRETYGNAVRIPDRTTTPSTLIINSNLNKSNLKSNSKSKRRRRPNISYSNEGDDDEITKVGRKSSEEIDFDEFFHVGDDIGNDQLSRRQGESDTKTSTTTKPKVILPPIYGKVKKRRRH